MRANIKPVTLATFPEVVTATVAQVDEVRCTLGANAVGMVTLGNIVKVDGDPTRFQVCPGGAISSTMTEAQYAKLGEDDEYAGNCLIDNLGLVRT